MQTSCSGRLEPPLVIEPEYTKKYQDFNQVRSKGCFYLSKAIWPNLKDIMLGITVSTQVVMPSETMDSNVSLELIGLTLLCCIFVLIFNIQMEIHSM